MTAPYVFVLQRWSLRIDVVGILIRSGRFVVKRIPVYSSSDCNAWNVTIDVCRLMATTSSYPSAAKDDIHSRHPFAENQRQYQRSH